MQRRHFLHASALTSGQEEIKLFKDFLEKTVAFVEKEVKAGKSNEEILKIASIPGVTYMQGTGLERSLGPVYDEVAAG